MQNLIAQREAFQKAFNKRIEIVTGEVPITSMDEKLIQKAIKIVEENLSDPDFSVERFSREVGMSRVHLYKKLLSLTGKTPIEFIRTIRLQRAAQLLEKSQLSVSEIAYQVGFNNPKYFSKYFRDQFHTLPSLYASGRK
jgi:transcriptional regulator GlxA family with amidase domain